METAVVGAGHSLRNPPKELFLASPELTSLCGPRCPIDRSGPWAAASTPSRRNASICAQSLGLAPAQPVTAVARRPGFVINRSLNCYRVGGEKKKKKET